MLTDRMDAGGAQTHIITLAKSLRERGHKIAVMSEGGEGASALSRSGIEHVRAPLASHSPIDLLVSYARVRRIARLLCADVIHSHARLPALIGSLAAKRLRLPTVSTAHAMFKLGYIRKKLSRWGTLCCAVSEDIKQYLCESYGVPPDNIRICPNGIDTRLFSPSNAKNADGLHIVFMSRLDGDCSLTAHLLCELAPRLSREIPRLRITIAGGGDAYARIRRECIYARASDGSQPDIEAIGNVKNTSSLLQNADIFIGVSRAALEAMSCGVPVILSGDEGFSGVLRSDTFSAAAADNFCARSGERTSAERLYSAIKELASMSDSERRALGDALRKELIRTHSAAIMADAAESLYAEALKRVPCEKGELVLCGYYGCGNTGDDALLRFAIERARQAYPELCVSALTGGGKADSERFGVRCVQRRNAIAVLREIRRARVFVLGGGTLLQDITSRRSLAYYTFLMRYAQRHGTRCELWWSGLGPLGHKKSRESAALALKGSAYIGVRDGASGSLAHRLTCGAETTPVLEYDPALDVKPTNEARTELLLSRLLPKGVRRFAVIAVNGSGTASKSRKGIREQRRMLRAIASLRKRGIYPLFSVMFPKEDLRVSKKLAERFGGSVAMGLSPSDLVGISQRAAAVYSSRLHALVFAKAANTPYLGFGTDPKIAAFCSI